MSSALQVHIEIIEKLRGIIRDNSIEMFRQTLSEEVTLNWMRQGGLDREGLCDEERGIVQKTLLHFACEKGRDVFVRELLEIKASPNVQAQGLQGKVARETPLHLAVLHQHDSSVRYLLAYKVRTTAIHFLDFLLPRAHFFLQANQGLGAQDSSGKTALHIAAGLKMSASNEKIINLLIDCKADMNIRDTQGRTALEYAQQKGNTETAKELKKFASRISEKTPGCEIPLPCTGKVEYYVKSWRETFGLNLEGFHMDEQATFSVTVASIAKLRDQEILMGRHRMPQNLKILDGMACVGGDSLSFMYHFMGGQVISNEFDPLRHQFLLRNMDLVRSELGRRSAAQRSRLGSVLDMWAVDEGGSQKADLLLFRSCDVLYLDPEWGGLGYREAGSSLHMQIGGIPLDVCVLDALHASHRLHWVVLKLPCNFDREHISRIIDSDSSPRNDSSIQVQDVPSTTTMTAQGQCELLVSSYRILLHGKEKMIFVIIERVKRPIQSSSNAVNTAEKWRRSHPEDMHVNVSGKRHTQSGGNGDWKRAHY